MNSFRFPVSPVDGDYQVLEVDYASYVVVYSCSQILFFKYELGWILTRAPKVSQELVSALWLGPINVIFSKKVYFLRLTEPCRCTRRTT